jgi:hypothetical protein
MPNIIRIVKSRRMLWLGHVANVGKVKNLYIIMVRKAEEKGALG